MSGQRPTLEGVSEVMGQIARSRGYEPKVKTFTVALDISGLSNAEFERWSNAGDVARAAKLGIEYGGAQNNDREIWRVTARDKEAARRLVQGEIARWNVTIRSIA